MTERVYLDYAATCPLDPRVREAMAPALSDDFGNASTLYQEGRRAFALLEGARHDLAEMLGAKSPAEVIFTSGGTESDNLAIRGLAWGMRDQGRIPGGKGHVICSAMEHEAVLRPFRSLSRDGFDVTVLPVSKGGFVELETLERALRDDTCLVSVMTANNEVGTIQDIPGLARIAHSKGALFHTDAVQALGKIPLDLETWGVDAASFSAHKIYGPKGAGVLYLRQGSPFRSWILGGGQEKDRRSGTENVAGALGLAAALSICHECLEEEEERLLCLRERFLAQLPNCSNKVKPLQLDGPVLPSIIPLLAQGIDSETLVMALDSAGFAVSGGAACSSRNPEPSHVLKAMGISDDVANGFLRISLGRFTESEEVDRLIAALPSILR